MIFTDDFFDELHSNNPRGVGTLYTFAKFRSESRRYIGQLNFLWNDLPQQVKENLQLRNRVLSPEASAFRGAFAEIAVHWILSSLGCDLIFNPSVNGKTPDFQISHMDGPHTAEVISVSESGSSQQALMDYSAVKNELNGVQSPFWLRLVDKPENRSLTPNEHGNANGLRLALVKYLGELSNYDTPDPDSIREVKFGQGSVRFYLEKNTGNGPLSVGLHLEMRENLDDLKLLRRTLEEKRSKYKQPFLAILVNAGNPALDSRVLDWALYGSLMTRYSSVNNEDGTHKWTASGTGRKVDGFWHPQNRDNIRNQRVEAVLFIDVRGDHDTGYRFECSMAKHPDLSTQWGRILPTVPNLEDEAAIQFSPPVLVP